MTTASRNGGVRDLLTLPVLAAVGGLVLLPVVAGSFLANRIVVFAVFVVGFNLLVGYTGEISFGHAAYFGLGAYGTILAVHHLTANVYAAMAVGTLVATAAGGAVGALSLRRRAIYFAMITLAFAQMVYHIVFRWTGFTGGSNGIGLPPETSAAVGPVDPLGGGAGFYPVGLVVLGLTWLGVRRVVRSPFGRALVSIRENEARATHLGLRTSRLLWVAFAMSALISGVGGALFALLFTFIAPGQLYWVTSGEVVLMALLGGIGTLGGPLVGAAAFIVLRDTLTQLTNDWRIFFGAVVVVVVLFAPQGVWGRYQEWTEEGQSFDAGWLRDRLRRRG